MSGPCACVTCNAMTHVIAACTELDVTKGNSARDFLVETVHLDRESISFDRFRQWPGLICSRMAVKPNVISVASIL